MDGNTFICQTLNSDNNILQRLSAGDHAAFEFLYNKYADGLLSYGAGLGFGKDVIEDAIQDVFFNVYVKRHLLANISSLKYYLLRSLRNRLLNIARSAVKTSEFSEDEFDFHIEVDAHEHIISREEQELLVKKVQDCMSCLAPRQREAIYLRFIHEMEYDQIAGILQMTPASARNLISRAVGKMRKIHPLWFLCFIGMAF